MAGIATAAAIGGIVSGVAGVAGGLIGRGKRKAEEKAAQQEMN